MVELLLSFFGNYLIEFMTVLLIGALTFRYSAYRQSKVNEAYFSKFTREIEANVDNDKAKRVAVDDVEDYLADILGRVNRALPSDSVRFSAKGSRAERDLLIGRDAKESEQSLRDYVGGSQGLIASIQSESSVFNVDSPPDFSELTYRIMEDDKNWTKLHGKIPIDGVSRMIDVLPSLFIVFGVFGTFIGISMALPEIAKIDFSDLENSGATLTTFVLNVTYAMKTSIAGIFFSLVLTFLNTLFPLEEMRDRTFKKVETCMHLLWYHIQNDNKAEREKEKLLPHILETLNKIHDLFEKGDHKKESTIKKAS